MSRLAAARTAVTRCRTTRTGFSRGTYSTSEIWPSPSVSIWASMASMSESSKSSPRDRKHLTRSGAPRNPFWSTSAHGAGVQGGVTSVSTQGGVERVRRPSQHVKRAKTELGEDVLDILLEQLIWVKRHRLFCLLLGHIAQRLLNPLCSAGCLRC